MNEEQNRAIGVELQDARLEKGLTLDDVQQQTKIQKRYLSAIEDGNFDQLPGTFYERAFVRQYAAVVGLDPAELLTKYNLETREVEPDLSSARVDADNVTRTGMHIEEETAADKTRQMMPKIVIGAVAVVLVAVIWWAVATFAGQSQQKAASSSSSSVSVSTSKVDKEASSKKRVTKTAKEKASSSYASSKKEEKAKLEIAAPEVVGRTSTVQVTPADKAAVLNVKLSANAAAWTLVTTANGTALFNGTLQPGADQTIEVPADATGIVVKSGNAAATTVEMDNKKVDLGAGDMSVFTSTINIAR